MSEKRGMMTLEEIGINVAPSLRVILEGVRAAIGTRDLTEFARALAPNPDWEQIEAVSAWHRLDGLLFQALSKQEPDRVPDPVLTRLRDRAKGFARKSLVLTDGLVRIAALFRQNGIPFVQVKGLTLAQLAYDAPALRPCLDLDVMIAPGHVDRGIELLERELGYRPFETVSPALTRYRTRVDYETAMHNEFVSLDLHWAFSRYSSMFPIDLDRTLANPCLVRIGGMAAPTLALPDLIPYLCFHGAKHLWVKLFWITDLAGLIQKNPDIDWDTVYERAEALGQTRTVTMGLLMAHQLFNCELPERVRLSAARDPRILALVLHTHKKLFNGQHENRPYTVDVSFFEKMVWGTRVYTKFREKAAIAGSYIFRPGKADVQALPVPSLFFPLLYLFRPIRLAVREIFQRFTRKR